MRRATQPVRILDAGGDSGSDAEGKDKIAWLLCTLTNHRRFYAASFTQPGFTQPGFTQPGELPENSATRADLAGNLHRLHRMMGGIILYLWPGAIDCISPGRRNDESRVGYLSQDGSSNSPVAYFGG